MSDTQVNIGQVKRDISELVNRVAFGGERVILTSRGKPKAAIVSLADYERLQQATPRAVWNSGKPGSSTIRPWPPASWRRAGALLDTDTLWDDTRRDLEERHDPLLDA